MIGAKVNFDTPSPAEWRDLVAMLDLFTARFAFAVVLALGGMAVFHAIRWAAS